MNAVNHNHHFFANGDNVKECWDSMLPLVKLLMKSRVV